MTKRTIFILTVFMFFFKNSVTANYEKKFYDFSIESITGEIINFNDFRYKKGSVTQTILAKIDVVIHNQNQNEVNLFVRRSFSQHLFSWMNDSASRL